MPIFSPDLKPQGHRQTSLLLLLCLLLASTCTLSAQSLVRPGWKGSGVSAEPWWKRAIFYNVSAAQPDFKFIAARLDALRALDVDAVILPAPALPAPGSNGPMPNLDDFEVLLRQAGSHRIRVLLTIQPSANGADLAGVARFWLNRGVAGLHIATPPGTSPEAAQEMTDTVRKLASGSLGQRIVISDVDLAPPAAGAPPTHRAGRTAHAADAAQLEIDDRPNSLATLDAAGLRPFLAQTAADPNLLIDLTAHDAANQATSPQAAPIAAISLIGHPAALIDSTANLRLEANATAPAEAEEPARPAALPTPAQPPAGTYLPYVPYTPPAKPKPVEATKPKPPDPLTVWYQQLAALHQDNATLRTGAKEFLDLDAEDVIAWVSRPPSPSLETPAVAVLCNLSGSAVQFSLADAMKHLDLRGTFLRTLLRSDSGLGGQDLNAVSLPPYGVYIGELRR